MRRQLRRLAGLGILAGVVIAAVAMLTWTAGDPSLSHATNAPVKNWIGKPGAILADLLMQLFGLAAVALLTVSAVWGWLMLRARPFDREGLRVPLGIGAAMMVAVAASLAPAPAGWPLPTGIGGVIGDGGVTVISALAGRLTGLSRIVALLVVATIGLFLFAAAIGWIFRPEPETLEEELDRVAPKARRPADDDREPGLVGGMVSNVAGAVTHGMLSARARVARMVAEAPAAARVAAGRPAEAQARPAGPASPPAPRPSSRSPTTTACPPPADLRRAPRARARGAGRRAPAAHLPRAAHPAAGR